MLKQGPGPLPVPLEIGNIPQGVPGVCGPLLLRGPAQGLGWQRGAGLGSLPTLHTQLCQNHIGTVAWQELPAASHRSWDAASKASSWSRFSLWNQTPWKLLSNGNYNETLIITVLLGSLSVHIPLDGFCSDSDIFQVNFQAY